MDVVGICFVALTFLKRPFLAVADESDAAQRSDEWFLCMVGTLQISFEFVVMSVGPLSCIAHCAMFVTDRKIERQKGIRWMPWHQEATKDVARCEKSWGTASRF